MKKKIFFGLGAIVLLAIIGVIYLSLKGRILSPSESVQLTENGLTLQVDYCRPSVRDRVIFGTEESGALQPYGKYWRLGANESTEFSIDQDVIVSGQLLKAGRYKLYAFPNEFDYEFGISKDTGTWGYAEPDYSLDVIRFRIPVEFQQKITEQHTISLAKSKTGIKMTIDFEKIRIIIPFDVAP